jgi:hypothetical protein
MEEKLRINPVARRTASSQISFTETDDSLIKTVKQKLDYYVTKHEFDAQKRDLCFNFLKIVVEIIKFNNVRFETEQEFQCFIAFALTAPCGYDPIPLLEKYKLSEVLEKCRSVELASLIYKSPLFKQLQDLKLGEMFINKSSSLFGVVSNSYNESKGTYRVGSKTVGTLVNQIAIDIFNELKTEYIPLGNLLFHKRGAEIDTGQRLLDHITFQELYDAEAYILLPFRDRYACAEKITERTQFFKLKEVSLTEESINKALKQLTKCNRNIRYLVGGTDKLKASIEYLLQHPEIIKAKLANTDPNYVPYLDNKEAMPALIALISVLPVAEKQKFFEKLICSTEINADSKVKIQHIITGIGLTEAKYMIKLIHFLPDSAGAMLINSGLSLNLENKSEVVMAMIMSSLTLNPERIDNYMIHFKKNNVDIEKLVMAYHDYIFKGGHISSKLWPQVQKLRMESFTTFYYSKFNKNGFFMIEGSIPIPIRAVKYIYSHHLEKEEKIQRELFKRWSQSTYAARSMIFEPNIAAILYEPIFHKQKLPENWELELSQIPEKYDWIEDKYSEVNEEKSVNEYKVEDHSFVGSVNLPYNSAM